MRKFLTILATISLCILAVIMESAPASAQARNVTIKGSDTLVILGQRWAEVYSLPLPWIRFPPQRLRNSYSG